MKIGIFNWRDLKHPQGGGAELYLHEQAKHWAKNGHEVVWFSSAVSGAPSFEIIDSIKFIRRGGKASVYLFAPRYYRKFMKDCDCIIDAENGIPFFTPLFSKKKKILLIHHIHKDVWFKEMKFPLAHLGYFLEMNLMPRIYKKFPIVTVSPSSQKEIRKLFPKNKIDLVYNAISSSYKPSTKSKNPEIVFVGRLRKYKSIDVLLRAVALLDKNVTVNIIGRGDDEARLKKISKELRLSNVVFHGFVSDEKKIKLIQRAWLAVNPSFVEGWSITNIEANACGTPVIGSDVQGIRDSIVEGKTGFLFQYGNEKELSEKINRLLENKKELQKMSKESIAWASRFSWEKSADAFLEIMKKNIT